jgi:hypothetical protein
MYYSCLTSVLKALCLFYLKCFAWISCLVYVQLFSFLLINIAFVLSDVDWILLGRAIG